MIINNLSRFQTHWDYETSGLGAALVARSAENWRTATLKWPSRGMSGMGCGCGCGGAGACGHGHGGDWMPLVCLAAIAAAAYWMGKGNGFLA